jgi:hypothetical protein
LLFAKASLDHNPPIYAFCHCWDFRHEPPQSAFSTEMRSYKLVFLLLFTTDWNNPPK